MGKPERGEAEELNYVDRPDVGETFVDSLESVMYDGNALRMEFVVHRFGSPQPGMAKNRKVTAVRLVIPLGGAINLTSQLNALMGALEQEGAIGGIRLVHSSEELN